MRTEGSSAGGASSRRKGFWSALSILLVVIVALLGVMLWCVGKLQNNTTARIQAIRDSGLPASYVDFEAWIGKVSDQENAAIPLQAAIDKHRAPQNPESPIPYVNKVTPPSFEQPFPDDMMSAASLYLASEQETLLHVNEAAKLSSCRFPLDLYTGYVYGFQHTAPLLELQRLMSLKAVYESETGNGESAYQALISGARLSEATRSEPTRNSQLNRIDRHALFVDALEQSLSRTTFSVEQLKSLQEEVEKTNRGDCMFMESVGERCIFLDRIANSSGSSGPVTVSDLVNLDHWGRRLQSSLDCERILTVMDSLVEASRLQPSEALERAKHIVEEDSRENQDGLQLFETATISDYAQMLCDDVEKQACDTCLLNCAATGIALLRYRQDNGAFPNALTELVPHYLQKVPVDWMDNQPLRYIHDEGGFTVYSVGPDKTDNGGLPPEKPSQLKKKGDIPFTVRLRPVSGT
ncbi:MAG: hypothetical protein K1Y02_14380 [Candidatus Hydrogenedentes bacterium]|nr:hypothetical protein [Candidatus Hydrogenedentota bacterium]